jgi:hypothetical protein
LVGCCPPWWVACLCPPWLWGLLFWSGGEDVKWWMSVRVDLQGTPEGYFIDWERALGVMTGWRTLLEYQAAGFFSRMRRVFVEQCLWIPELGIFCGFLRQGALVFAYSAQVKFPNAFKKSKVRSCKQEGIITIQAWKLKFFIYCRRSNIPSTI